MTESNGMQKQIFRSYFSWDMKIKRIFTKYHALDFRYFSIS